MYNIYKKCSGTSCENNNGSNIYMQVLFRMITFKNVFVFNCNLVPFGP